MEKHTIATGKKNQHMKIFPKRIELFLERYVGNIIMKEAKQ